MMSLNEYQEAAGVTNKGTKLFTTRGLVCSVVGCDISHSSITEEIPGLYNVLAINGEAGELGEKLKKHARDGVKDYLKHREECAKELGDVLWYVSQAAKDFDFTLEQIAEINLKKLADRKQRGVLSGSGDNR